MIRVDRAVLEAAPPVDVQRHETDDLRWELATRRPPPDLRPVIRDYCGFDEHARGSMSRREVPHGGVVLIVNLGEPLDIRPDDPTRSYRSSPDDAAFGSFVAGLHETAVFTEYTGSSSGVQVNLTPLGAHRLLGLPMDELSNQVIDLDLVPMPQLGELTDRLAATDSWTHRLALLDTFFRAWNRNGAEPDRPVAWAWHQMVASHGQVAVSSLADEIGWSRRHFAERFRRQVGLTPKSTARVLRFNHAAILLGDPSCGSITDVAAACGFADHSHLVRDFQSLGGCTPSQYRRSLLPAGAGVIA